MAPRRAHAPRPILLRLHFPAAVRVRAATSTETWRRSKTISPLSCIRSTTWDWWVLYWSPKCNDLDPCHFPTDIRERKQRKILLTPKCVLYLAVTLGQVSLKTISFSQTMSFLCNSQYIYIFFMVYGTILSHCKLTWATVLYVWKPLYHKKQNLLSIWGRKKPLFFSPPDEYLASWPIRPHNEVIIEFYNIARATLQHRPIDFVRYCHSEIFR